MSAIGGWASSSQRLPACGVDHGPGPGRLDETARRLDHPELAVARRLVAEGHVVSTVAERGRRGSVPDFMVCGTPLEVKCLLTMAERGDGRRATGATVHNRLVSAVDQAGVVVVATGGSGCTAADAAAGLHSFAATVDTGKVAAVRVVGDGFDLSWQGPVRRQAGRETGQDAGPEVGRRVGREATGARRARPTSEVAPTRGGVRQANGSGPAAPAPGAAPRRSAGGISLA